MCPHHCFLAKDFGRAPHGLALVANLSMEDLNKACSYKAKSKLYFS